MCQLMVNLRVVVASAIPVLVRVWAWFFIYLYDCYAINNNNNKIVQLPLNKIEKLICCWEKKFKLFMVREVHYIESSCISNLDSF